MYQENQKLSRPRIRQALVVVGLASAILGVAPAGASLPEGASGIELVEPSPADWAVASFLKAVDRGELMVFDARLYRDAVIPRRVDYVYDLPARLPAVKVHADLLPPVDVPGDGPCAAHGVCVTLDQDGKIIDSEIHIWCE